MGVLVRTVRAADKGAAARALALAFDDDPVFGWLLPQSRTRVARSTRFFATTIKHLYLSPGTGEIAVDRDGAVVGAALWTAPTTRPPSRRAQLRMLPGLALAFRSRLGVAAAVADELQRTHPTEPHWYLAMVGTVPRVRGTGFGHTLIASRLGRCDIEGVGAYLESSKPENVPYYERFGFEVTGEIVLPGGGPTLWPMWRRPV